MQSFNKSIISKRNLNKDVIGIVVILTLGIGGLIFVFNPVWVLIPKHPMISPEDWPGSRTTQGLEITGSEQWEEKRELFIRLKSKDDSDGHDAEITQKAIWYADPMKPVVELQNQIGRMTESSLNKDKPAFVFDCLNNGPPPFTCNYHAAWGHWYTEVHFSSRTDKYLSFSEMQRIISRVDQLLTSASDPVPMSPPYVFISTATAEATQPGPLLAPMGFIGPLSIDILACPKFKASEKRRVPKDTLILGDVIIDGVEQFDPNNSSEGMISYFEKESTVTTPIGADCYTGGSYIIDPVIQNELLYGCGSKCTSIRFVLVQNDGQHVEIYR
jgi:hypothetical protein